MRTRRSPKNQERLWKELSGDKVKVNPTRSEITQEIISKFETAAKEEIQKLLGARKS